MGYTHYFTQMRDLNQTEWQTLREHWAEALNQLQEGGLELAFEYDEPERPVLLDGEILKFNGVGDDGYETFVLTRLMRKEYEYEKGQDREGRFDFCKTAYKPYDLAVTTCLTIAHSLFPDAWKIKSDGSSEDWQEAMVFTADALGDKLDCPIKE